MQMRDAAKGDDESGRDDRAETAGIAEGSVGASL
jgi:hypothetical protein